MVATLDVQQMLWFGDEMMVDPNFRDAALELAVARQHFDMADPTYVDAAIHQLNLAESRLNALYASNQGKNAPEYTETPLPWIHRTAERMEHS